MELELFSLNVGKPTTVLYKGREVVTAIAKSPVAGPLRLDAAPLPGDEQADAVHHGGPDKAICAYCYEHYPYWERTIGKPLSPGAFGENFTLLGATEDEVRIGDTFRLGDALLQVSQPRVPCFKLSARHERPTLEAEVTASGFTGFYLRVLNPGAVAAGDRLRLETPHPAGVTVAEANRIMHRDKRDAAGLRRLLDVDALADSWRSQLSKRL
ncbi:MOSC domain-containing protein [Paenibacillus antri]|uniref:MOSC domain-containing protein n=1 Tax=Paenibacillus antri TaxID=2582848 RepID=A0A5R9G0N3_9BACL|nr:MOSC domain-containing protein [Paenibacillus antri]TLS49877.1 MOSC domain-containing protein [Paenibacillus antri]